MNKNKKNGKILFFSLSFLISLFIFFCCGLGTHAKTKSYQKGTLFFPDCRRMSFMEQDYYSEQEDTSSRIIQDVFDMLPSSTNSVVDWKKEGENAEEMNNILLTKEVSRITKMLQ